MHATEAQAGLQARCLQAVEELRKVWVVHSDFRMKAVGLRSVPARISSHLLKRKKGKPRGQLGRECALITGEHSGGKGHLECHWGLKRAVLVLRCDCWEWRHGIAKTPLCDHAGKANTWGMEREGQGGL